MGTCAIIGQGFELQLCLAFAALTKAFDREEGHDAVLHTRHSASS